VCEKTRVLHLEGSGSHLALQPVFQHGLGSRPVGARRRSVLAVRETAELGRPGRTADEAHCARPSAFATLCVARKSSAARPLQALAATRLQPWWCAKYHLLLQVGSEQDRSQCRRGCVKERRMHSSARGVVHDLLRSRLASNAKRAVMLAFFACRSAPSEARTRVCVRCVHYKKPLKRCTVTFSSCDAQLFRKVLKGLSVGAHPLSRCLPPYTRYFPLSGSHQ